MTHGRERMRATVLATLALGVFVGLTAAAPSGMVWTQAFDGGPGQDYGQAVAVSGRRVLVAGRGGPNADPDRITAAYDSRDGRELWSDMTDTAGGFDMGWHVSGKGPRVFTVGRVWNGVDADVWIVDARRAGNGQALWSDTFDLGGDFAIGLWGGVKGRRLIVAGYANDEHDVAQWVIRTHDVRNGALLWDDAVDPESGTAVPQDAAIARGRVVVVGYVTAAVGFDILVRCYSVRDGELLWNRRIDPHGRSDLGSGVYVHGNTVVVSSGVTDPSGDFDMVVMGLDLRDGSDLWEDVYDTGIEERGWRIAGQGRRAWVLGWLEDGDGKRSTVVRAFDVRDGAVQWTHVAGDPADSFSAGRIARLGRHLVFTSNIGEPGGDLDALLRVLDGRSGETRWDERIDTIDGGEWAGGVAAKGRTFFVPLHSRLDGEDADLRVEAYRVR